MARFYDDPERYDRLYRDFHEDISFYREVAESTSGPIVDLACGTGRVTTPLATVFVERAVYGVDLSESQLSLARSRGEEAGAANLGWFVAAMERFEPPAVCGLAVCALHSLEHLTREEDVDQFFSNLAGRVLRPGGRFAFALHLPDPAYLRRQTEGIERLRRYEEPGGGGFTLYERRSYDPSRQLLALDWFFEPEDGGEVEAVSYELRLYYPREIRRILAEHGFELLGHWGWYDRRELSGESGTQVLLAEMRR